jgi:hypothetical protein
MESCGIFHLHLVGKICSDLVYDMAIYVVYFVIAWCVFGILYKWKSGNPGNGKNAREGPALCIHKKSNSRIAPKTVCSQIVSGQIWSSKITIVIRRKNYL